MNNRKGIILPLVFFSALIGGAIPIDISPYEITIPRLISVAVCGILGTILSLTLWSIIKNKLKLWKAIIWGILLGAIVGFIEYPIFMFFLGEYRGIGFAILFGLMFGIIIGGIIGAIYGFSIFNYLISPSVSFQRPAGYWKKFYFIAIAIFVFDRFLASKIYTKLFISVDKIFRMLYPASFLGILVSLFKYTFFNLPNFVIGLIVGRVFGVGSRWRIIVIGWIWMLCFNLHFFLKQCNNQISHYEKFGTKFDLFENVYRWQFATSFFARFFSFDTLFFTLILFLGVTIGEKWNIKSMKEKTSLDK
ncbi:MAG: hypothetical protein Q7K21_03055 [Elusimicrobiota bacterium]|nr:hypothetical protein [Elusimicrobiota bacterium]